MVIFLFWNIRWDKCNSFEIVHIKDDIIIGRYLTCSRRPCLTAFMSIKTLHSLYAVRTVHISTSHTLNVLRWRHRARGKYFFWNLEKMINRLVLSYFICSDGINQLVLAGNGKPERTKVKRGISQWAEWCIAFTLIQKSQDWWKLDRGLFVHLWMNGFLEPSGRRLHFLFTWDWDWDWDLLVGSR